MSQSARLLASGPGWHVADIVCTSGAGDRPFEEEHRNFCIAAVTAGTFGYRSRQGAALLAPGALLLGNAGACFECGHEHGRGDRCLSFHFSPDHWERLVAETHGARRLDFAAPSQPAASGLAGLLADAEAARDLGDAGALEEVSLRIADAALSLPAGVRRQAPGSRDRKRVAEAVRLIELEAERPLSLGELASAAATSPFHFLRSFRAVAGMTPYQYLLRTRLHRAAIRLRTSDEPVSAIAFDAGFADLSTFNRRFRRVIGTTPGAWRAARRIGGRPAGAGDAKLDAD